MVTVSKAAVLKIIFDSVGKPATEIYQKVRELPPAATVHAHWYLDDGCAYYSNCRNNFKKAIMAYARFCPMCGVKMEVGQDDG